MILDEYIDVTVNKSNAKHYEELGYLIEREKDSKGRDRIKCGQIITVKVSDLSYASNVNINVECDYCHEKFKRKYQNIYRSYKTISKDACRNCTSIKSQEVKIKLYNTTNTAEISKMNDSVPGRSNKYSWNDVIEKCNERNYTFCSSNDISQRCICKSNVYYICNLHSENGEQKTSVEHIMNNNRIYLCKSCRISQISKAQSQSSIDDAIKIANEKNYTILTKHINNCDDKIEYICNIHKNYGIQNTTLYGLKRYKNNCRMCKMPKNEEHWHWNGGISSEREQFKNTPEYREWRKAVFKRDNYTCQCCGKKSKKLEAHHKYNYAEYPELRLDVDNGITLCENCHSINIPGSFHSIYTQYHNTPEQLEEYIKNYNKQQILNKQVKIKYIHKTL